MEVCTNTPQATGQLNGAASPYVDPDFEFNAPRFYDFQRLNDNVSSPSSEGDTYFDTSKVKGSIPAAACPSFQCFFCTFSVPLGSCTQLSIQGHTRTP